MKTVSTNSLHATITDENGMCAFCPTPISVRKDKQTEIVELGRKNIMFINDMEVDITDIEDVTRFGISPFVINMTHKDSALKNIFSLQKAMKEVSDEERDM